jgi:hypothetical protein
MGQTFYQLGEDRGSYRCRSRRHSHHSPHGSLSARPFGSADHTFAGELAQTTTRSVFIVRQINRFCQGLALAFSSALPAFVASNAAAQSVSAPTLITSHLTEGTVHNRLVPLTRAKASRTTSWVTERRFTEHRGSPAVLQVMTTGASDHVHTDSLLFIRATLRPIWEHLHGGGMATSLSFDGTHVTGRLTQKDSAAHAINVTTTAPSFSTTIDDVVVQSIPLVRGYRVVLPFVGGSGSVESETIRVRGSEPVSTAKGARDAWAVDLSYPSGSETLWIDPATRAILRHIYTLKDHSQLEVVTS